MNYTYTANAHGSGGGVPGPLHQLFNLYRRLAGRQNDQFTVVLVQMGHLIQGTLHDRQGMILYKFMYCMLKILNSFSEKSTSHLPLGTKLRQIDIPVSLLSPGSRSFDSEISSTTVFLVLRAHRMGVRPNVWTTCAA